MSIFKTALVLGVSLAMGFLLSVPARGADAPDQSTQIIFGEPMQVPGLVLEPGTYLFRLVDAELNRHTVQIFSEDGSELLASIVAIPNYGMKAFNDSNFEYWETPQGIPYAIRAWFHPGDDIAQEFQYPMQEAAALSALINREVPMLVEDQSDDPEAVPARIPNAESDAVEPAMAMVTGATEAPEEEIIPPDVPPLDVVEPAMAMVTGATQATEKEIIPGDVPPLEMAVAMEATTWPASQEVTEAEPTPKELAKTAGLMPLFGVLGLVSLGMASLVRLVKN